jgi:hypothetical protein
VTNPEQVPPSAQGFPVITRPNVITDDPAPFIAELAGHLRTISAQSESGRLTEPQRLFEVKEYAAAVISALTLLETTLRKRLNRGVLPSARRSGSLASLVHQAVEQKVIRPQLRMQIESWMRTRNAIVHSSAPIGRAQAREIVQGISEILKSLE